MVLEMHHLASGLCFQRCQVVCRKQDQAHKASTAQDSGQGVCGPEMSTTAPPGREDLCSALCYIPTHVFIAYLCFKNILAQMLHGVLNRKLDGLVVSLVWYNASKLCRVSL